MLSIVYAVCEHSLFVLNDSFVMEAGWWGLIRLCVADVCCYYPKKPQLNGQPYCNLQECFNQLPEVHRGCESARRRKYKNIKESYVAQI